jgi:chromosome segregation ATPase
MAEGEETLAPGEEDSHPAVILLADLFQAGTVGSEAYSNLLFKFKKLHHAFSQSCSTEQALLRRTRELNKELKSQKVTIQNSATQQQEHRTALTTLRQYVTNIQAELDATREQIETTRANTVLKKREREKLADKVAKARDDQITKIAPQQQQINAEISALEQTISKRRQEIDHLKAECQKQTEAITRADSDLAEIDKKKRSYDQRMTEISSIPIKTRQKSSAVEGSHSILLNEEKSVNHQLAVAESNLSALRSQARDYENDYQHITNDMEGMSEAVSDLKQQTEELRQKCSEQTNAKQQSEYESRRLHKLVGEQNREIGNMEAKLDTIAKDSAKREKESKKLEDQIGRARVEIMTNTAQLSGVQKAHQKEADNNARLEKERQRSLEDKGAAIKEVLAVETLNEQAMKDIKAALIEKDRKQSIHDELSQKERELIFQLTEAALIRDRKARETAGMKKRTLDCRTQAMERNLDFLDLCRKVDLNSEQLKDLSELYEKVKLDRNRNMNTIQTSRQLIVEYKEKIRILENEVEVLRLEFEKVSESVRLQKSELTAAFKRRDTTRTDLKTAEIGYSELQTKIDFQSSEISRMNTVLGAVEALTTDNQKLYDRQAADCSDIQMMLMDKRDELTLIQEQFNRHEFIMKKGAIALRDREEELKLLNLSLNDFTRQIDIMQRKIPQLRAYEAEIVKLDHQLSVARREVDRITAKLEAPDLKERQRAYCGKDFSMKELEEKVAVYEQRINAKGQQLWEKQILLHEIDEKIAEVTRLSGLDDPKTVKSFEKSGTLRAETMLLRRKKMAALAESAVYRAQKGELEDEKSTVKEEIVKATERAEAGQPFDKYAEKMVRMHQRDMKNGAKRRTQFDSDDDEEKKPGRQHFDAYPTADGLSRPYGAFPVFQPAPPSGQLRHFRNESLVPIEL